MLRCFHFFGVLALAMAGTACARVGITKLADAKTYKEGLRFYRPAPYVVRSIEKNVCTDRIVYLPDPDEEYLIRVHSGWGTVDAKVTLQDGWNLTAIGEARDSKIPETITAVGGLLTAATAKVLPGGEAAAPKCEQGLFKLIYDKEKHSWGMPR